MKRLPKIFSLFIAVMLLSSCTLSVPTVDLPSEPSDVPSEDFVSAESEQSQVSSEEQSAVPQDTHATISFGGDILIHTPLFTTAKTGDNTYDFKQFLQYGMEGFFDSDWNVCNMENPIDVNGDNSGISTYPAFNAPREIIDFPVAYGLDTLIFCNNHVYDKKYKGFVATVNNLREKIDVTGAYLSEDEYNTPYIRDVNGIKVGLICYTDHVNGNTDSTLTPYSVRTFKLAASSAPAMVEDIRALKEAGAEFVIVYLHWGSEYKNNPSDTQKKLAKLLCDGGADVIMGMHSHCVQPIEKYTADDGRECVIMYSLGNLFTDQTGLQFNEKYGKSYIKTQYGMKVTLSILKDGETGKVSITGGEYAPTMLYRRKQNGNYIYYYLEPGRYVSQDGSAGFDTPLVKENCILAFDHVTNVVGDDIPVKEY